MVPLLGVRNVELLEQPLVSVAVFLAAKLIVRRFGHRSAGGPRKHLQLRLRRRLRSVRPDEPHGYGLLRDCSEAILLLDLDVRS